MKKVFSAILLFDLMAGLLFFGFCEAKNRTAAVNGGAAATAEDREEDGDVKKIAITFDDEVIIGLSQEICCIEAISLI